MKETLNKGVKSFVFHVFGSIAGIIIQVIAAKILGVEEYGKANYLLGIISTYYIFYLFGIQYYLPIEFQKNNSHKSIFSNILITTSIIYIVTLPVLFFLEIDRLGLRDMCIVLIMIWLFVLMEYIRTYYIAKNSADKSTFYTVFSLKALNLLLLISFFVFNWGNYLAFIVSILISQLLIIIVLFYKKVKFVVPNFSYLKFVFIFYFIQLFNFFLFNYSKVIQGDLLGNKSVALLSIALVIGQSINMISMNFANVLLPVFSFANLKNDVSLMRSNFMKMAKVNAHLSLPILFYISFFSKEILLLLGSDFEEGSSILILIVFGNFFNSFVGPNGSLLLMSGRQKLEFYNGFAKLAVGLLIIYFYGANLWGVALGLMVSEILVNLLKGIEVYRIFKILPYTKQSVYYLSVVFCIEFAVFYAIYFSLDNHILKMFIGLISILIMWYLSFKLSPFKSDKLLIDNLLNKIYKR